jgi:hypothetical protein
MAEDDSQLKLLSALILYISKVSQHIDMLSISRTLISEPRGGCNCVKLLMYSNGHHINVF